MDGMLLIVAVLGIALLATVRWIRRRGPVPEDPTHDPRGRQVLLYLAFNYGTIIVLAIIVEIWHLPARTVFGIGVGALFLTQALVRPAVSAIWNTPIYVALYYVLGTVLIAVGFGVI